MAENQPHCIGSVGDPPPRRYDHPELQDSPDRTRYISNSGLAILRRLTGDSLYGKDLRICDIVLPNVQVMSTPQCAFTLENDFADNASYRSVGPIS